MLATVTASTPAPAAPLNKKERILFLDSVRGMALLGILVMNITAQSQSHYFYSFLNLNQPVTGPNFYAWAIETGLFEGTMRGLFSILFGAGTILLINRLEKSRGHLDAADIYYRRILWLLVFGVINAYVFLWPGDILYAYALCGLVLFPFRNLAPKKLLICASIILAFGLYRDSNNIFAKKAIISKGKQAELLQSRHKKLSKNQAADLKAWKEFKEKASNKTYMKKAAEETQTVQKANYPKLFAYYRDINVELEGAGFYNGWWDMMIFFFIGMALYKSGFLTGGSPVWLYASIAVIGIAIGLSINYWTLGADYNNRFDGVKYFEHTPFDLYTLRRLLQTLGYLSLLILLYKAVPLRGVFHVFAPVGQMAFTNYLSQSIITSVIFYGMGWYGYLQRYELYYVVAGIWIFQIVFSNIWLQYFLFGPFEWLWRSLTYMKVQPFKKVREIASLETVSATVANL